MERNDMAITGDLNDIGLADVPYLFGPSGATGDLRLRAGGTVTLHLRGGRLAAERGARPLGAALLTAGAVTAADLGRGVEEQVVTALACALAAGMGTFTYASGDAAPASPAADLLDPQRVLLEATRRLDEGWPPPSLDPHISPVAKRDDRVPLPNDRLIEGARVAAGTHPASPRELQIA
jgi:hypothetical protein